MSTAILQSGDPRPWFADLLVASYPGVVAYDSQLSIVFECKLNEAGKYMRNVRIEGALQKPTTPFVILGITVTTKVKCVVTNKAREAGKVGARPDQAKHWIPLIWNVALGTVMAINPLSYHLKDRADYATTLAIKRVKAEDQLPAFMASQGYPLRAKLAAVAYSASMVQSVKKWVVDNGGGGSGESKSAMLWFPLVVLWDLDTRFAPKKKVNEPTDVAALLTTLQSRFESHYLKKAQKRQKCLRRAPSILYKPETARCVRPDSKVGLELQRIRKERLPKGLPFDLVDKSLVTAKEKGAERTFVDNFLGSSAYFTYTAARHPHVAVLPASLKWLVVHEQNPKNPKDPIKTSRMVLPPGFDAFWTAALKDTSVKQILVMISLHDPRWGHANALMYTKATKELEIFEPNGKDHGDMFMAKELHAELASLMTERFGLPKLLTPNDYCPRKMQIFQSMETDEESLWFTEGYCAAWTMWYTEMRMSNPKLKTKQCVKLAMAKLMDAGSLRSFIWNYDRWIRREVERTRAK
jgi:hypothetical protein